LKLAGLSLLGESEWLCPGAHGRSSTASCAGGLAARSLSAIRYAARNEGWSCLHTLSSNPTYGPGTRSSRSPGPFSAASCCLQVSTPALLLLSSTVRRQPSPGSRAMRWVHWSSPSRLRSHSRSSGRIGEHHAAGGAIHDPPRGACGLTSA